MACSVTSPAWLRGELLYSIVSIYTLFCLCVKTNYDVPATVEKLLTKLGHKPKNRALLLSLDLLVIEEVGIVNKEITMCY